MCTCLCLLPGAAQLADNIGHNLWRGSIKHVLYVLVCRVLCDVRSGAASSAVVLGEVVLLHIADGVVGRSPSGKLVVDPLKLQPVCRLGGVTYGRVTELYDIGRPDKHGVYPAANK
jgi:hypothetical protein